MPTEDQHILIVENVPAWQTRIGRVVEQALPGAIIHTAGTATEALRILKNIQDLQSETRAQIAILSDLHLSMHAEDDDNGDRLVRELIAADADVPPMALVSGTALRYAGAKDDMREAIPELPSFDKDASLFSADGTPARQLLIDNIRKLAAGGFGQIPKNPAYAEYLKNLKHRPADAKKKDVFIDEIKPMTDEIWQTYNEFLAQIPEAQFLKEPALYDPADTNGIKIHEYKNTLSMFIKEKLASQAQSLPEGLLEKLIALQIFINQGYMRLSEDSPKTSPRRLAQTVFYSIANFVNKEGETERIHFTDHGDDKEIDVDPAVFEHILVEAMMNAIAHSPKDSTVDVFLYKEDIGIYNAVSKHLPFKVMNSRVMNGSIPQKSTSASGSGKGLTHMLAAARASGINICMEAENFHTKTVIDFSPSPIHVESPVTPEVEPGLPFPNVVFVCHQNIPEQTFSKLIDVMPAGYKAHCIHPPTDLANMGRFLRENSDLLEKTSLLVMHTRGIDTSLNETFQPVHAEFPQIVLLPASDGETMNMRLFNLQEDLEQDIEYGADPEHPELENLILPEHIDHFYQEGRAHATRGATDSLHYGKSYSPEFWSIILEYAQSKAVERKAATEKESV